MEDFVPWVPPISSHPSDWEEEEGGGGWGGGGGGYEMSDLFHNFVARKRKRDASFKKVVDAIPEVAKGEDPDVQVIVISCSPEMGSND